METVGGERIDGAKVRPVVAEEAQLRVLIVVENVHAFLGGADHRQARLDLLTETASFPPAPSTLPNTIFDDPNALLGQAEPPGLSAAMALDPSGHYTVTQDGFQNESKHPFLSLTGCCHDCPSGHRTKHAHPLVAPRIMTAKLTSDYKIFF